jgi:S-disulfanyl-L-cysteine oxidoreductase SoxD
MRIQERWEWSASPKLVKILLSVFGWILLFGFAVAQAGDRTSWSGVFTVEQAKNGDRIYHERCSKCHGPDLVATDPDAPDLTADGFKLGWIGKTVGNRFRTIRIAMPADAPGSLDEASYIDIIAFVLSFNGHPPGNEKLLPEADALEQIVIVSGP